MGKLPSFSLSSSPEKHACEYGKPATCPADQVCAYVDKSHAQCIARYIGSTPFLRFPFQPDHPVICLQGTETTGTHRTADTLFALDLASLPTEKSGGTVFSAIDGTALVYQGCADSKSSDYVESVCQDGFGNHVRVLNTDGIMILYGQLGQIWVQDGQNVKAGQAIGTEGQSGDAKVRHLHFSAHHAPIRDWLETLSYYRARPGFVPPSIPFETQYCDPALKSECLRKRTRMDEVPCAPASHAVLRADWRD